MPNVNKDFSTKQEKLIANFVGASVVSGSGARPCHPGDVKSTKFLIEAKTHTGISKVKFLSRVWDKIKDEAMFSRRYPVLVNDDGSQKIDHQWCVCPTTIEHTDDVVIVDYNTVKFKEKPSSFTFNHYEMIDLYRKTLAANNAEFAYFKVTLGSDILYLMPLETFKCTMADL